MKTKTQNQRSAAPASNVRGQKTVKQETWLYDPQATSLAWVKTNIQMPDGYYGSLKALVASEVKENGLLGDLAYIKARDSVMKGKDSIESKATALTRLAMRDEVGRKANTNGTHLFVVPTGKVGALPKTITTPTGKVIPLVIETWNLDERFTLIGFGIQPQL